MAYDISALSLAAANVSYNGVDLGFTRDGVQLDIKTTTRRLEIDHFTFTETREIVMRREASIKFKLLEMTAGTMFTGTGAGGGGGMLTGGLFTQPIAAGLEMQNYGRPLRLHPVDRPTSDHSQDFVFPKAVWSGNVSHYHRMDEVRMIILEFTAYRDPTLDVLFQYGV